MVYVLNKDGHPLMPTKRHGKVKWLLRAGKAKVVNKSPFTIQLTYEGTHYVQPVTLGIDPGRTNIGIAAVTDDGMPLFSAKCMTRNKEVPKLMKERAAYRRSHRKHGRREPRQRRAKTNNTETPGKTLERMLPSCNKPVTCKSIQNKESRFCNRKRPDGWLTPTARHLLQTHLNLVKKIMKFLPISQISLELNSFAFMRLDDPSVTGKDFQDGPLKGFGRDVKLAVWNMQEGKCLLCNDPIEEYHHVRARHKNGSETVKNRVGLCSTCHRKVHTDAAYASLLSKMNDGIRKRYDALGILNQIIPSLVNKLGDICPVTLVSGMETKQMRMIYNIPKDHHYDAYAIALSGKEGFAASIPGCCHLIKQFRRHDRQACQKEMVNRNYLLDGKTVATNRHKAFEQATLSLDEYVGASGRTDVLAVKPHPKIMKDRNRVMPGSQVFHNGRSKILLGCKNHYYEFDDGTKTASRRIILQNKNAGLVFVSNK